VWDFIWIGDRIYLWYEKPKATKAPKTTKAPKPGNIKEVADYQVVENLEPLN
jgi:hypothetical protein